MSDKSTNQADVLTHRQRFAHALTTAAAILRSKCGTDSLHLSTGACSLVRQNVEKVSPPRITDTLGQVWVPDHIFDLQILNGDQVKLTNQRCRRLEMKVLPLPADSQMLLLQKSDG